jgi:putative DNA primase/helicase
MLNEPSTLKELGQWAKDQVYAELKEKENNKPAPITKQQKTRLSEQIPGCIRYIIEQYPPKSDKISFNRLTMLLVSYFKTLEYSQPEAWLIAQEFVESYPYSETYSDAARRTAHFNEQWEFQKNNAEYQFSCAYPKSLSLPPGAFNCSQCLDSRNEALFEQAASEPLKILPVILKPKDILDALYRNQDGDAELYCTLNRDRFLYDHTERQWYKWAGHYWQKDITGSHVQALDAVIDRYLSQHAAFSELSRQAAAEGKKDEYQKTKGDLLKRVRELQAIKRKKAVLELSTYGSGGLGIEGTEWDRNPYLLPCLNGVIDLKTGELNPGYQGQFVRNVCPVNYDPDAQEPKLFLKSANEIFSYDQELIGFVQRVFGLALIGAQIEHIFVILVGPGRNGKDTFIKAICRPLGLLATPVQSEFFLDQSRTRSSAGPSPDIVYLRGKRLIFASETNEDRRLDAGVVKWITGGSELIGRGSYAKHHTRFAPTHTTFLLTNFKPHAASNDYSLWQRLFLIPFNVKFVDDPQRDDERKRDEHLDQKVYAEAPLILKWLVQGCISYQKTGLNAPEAVRLAKSEYYQRDM